MITEKMKYQIAEIWTPIEDCKYQDKEDGTCTHDGQVTPECHVFACPRLHPLIEKLFSEVLK